MDEQNIPIDINTTKLLEWLISRRHVSKDWQNKTLKIREKINNAIQDMPEHKDIVKLLSGQHINYFHCLKIIEILKETEADSKNLFGRYGSQRMKDWQDIVNSYQQDGLYLAEVAQLLIRNVNFEVPSLRKQVAKFEQAQIESEKKIKEYSKTELVTQNEFNIICKQMGIPGSNIKKELLGLLSELPELYEQAANKTKTVKEAVDVYVAFIKYHSDNNDTSDVLPLLRYVIDHGNTTTYEYNYGKKPSSIEVPEMQQDSDNSDGIDFGDDLNYSSIDWNNVSIDDGFEIVEHSDLDGKIEEAPVIIDNSGNDIGIARGNEAYTVLDNPKTRDLFLKDLSELEAFLAMRLLEMSNESDLLSISQMQDAPAILQLQTLESVTSMIGHVKTALKELTNERTQHLHNIKHSAKYIDMLTTRLNQKLSVIERIAISKRLLQEKIEDAQLQIKKIQPVITLVIDNTKILQKQTEADISKRYKGRPVHIVGAVNTL